MTDSNTCKSETSDFQQFSRRDCWRAAAGCAAAGTLVGTGGVSKELEAAVEAEQDKTTIRDVKFYNLEATLNDPFAWPNGYAESRTATAIRIETDQGIVGWGHGWGFVKDLGIVKEVILNQSPFDTWRLSQQLAAKWVTTDLRGAVDIALWDIKGKVLGMPIHQLLGGALRDRVFAYACAGYYGHPKDSLDWLKNNTEPIAREGFRYFKMKAGIKDFDYEKQRMDIVQNTMGKDCRIAVDSTTMLTVESAMILGRELEARNIWWFEDPLPATNIEGYRRLSQELKIPICAHDPACRDLKQFVKSELVRQVNPWFGHEGGFSYCRQLIAITSLHGVVLRPNCWSTHLQMAAALHLLALIPSRSESPDQDAPVLEFDRSDNPLREDSILTQPLRLESDGTVKVPSGPGLGVDVDENKLKKYAVSVVS
ncbi:MAG: hypothetical protein FJW69_09955 [Actinobacteria bacterium]|nr:hypothetical protein [Actinomycetota bacterium]